MHTVYLLIGGNLGDRAQHLEDAIGQVAPACGDIITISSLYETAAWGMTAQSPFLNQVIILKTQMPPESLMACLLDIEKEMRRLRQEKMGPRTIDIDILLIDDLELHTHTLTVPHPSLHLRRFALTPLAEVAASVIHPTFNKTIAELLTDCPDMLPVTRIS